MNDQFRERLKHAQQRCGLTNEEVANCLDCSVRAVAHWRAGTRIPTYKRVMDIAIVLRTSVPYLLGFDEEIAWTVSKLEGRYYEQEA